MTETQIQRLHNFNLNESDVYGRKIFKRYSDIQTELMERTDYSVSLAKEYLPNVIFRVVDINLGIHTEGSLHYDGKAIDGFFEDTKENSILPLGLQYFLISLGGFKGLGVYPEHTEPKIHADIRDQDNVSVWYAYYSEKPKKKQLYEYNRLKVAEVLGCGLGKTLSVV